MASTRKINESARLAEADDVEETPAVGGEDLDLDLDLDLGDEGDEMESDEGSEEEVAISADLAQELLTALESELGEDEEVEVEEEPAEEEAGDEEVVEIDESMLRTEIARMKRGKRLAEEKKSAGRKGAADPKVLDDFGGAKVEREPFVDSDDSDLNIHAEVRKLKSELMKESRKNRALNERLVEYRKATAALQEQLEQMNLFNAKLLYVNKLVSNDSVTARQKKSIVEALDKAKTLREVKLLYKTLTESLSKSKKSETVSESVHRSASSSRTTASASSKSSTLAEGYQADRWATLANLKETK